MGVWFDLVRILYWICLGYEKLYGWFWWDEKRCTDKMKIS